MSNFEPSPLLIEVPEEMIGERVLVRNYRREDAGQIWEAIDESRDSIRQWLPWEGQHQDQNDTLEFVVRAMARWILREDLSLGVFLKDRGRFLGGTGLHRINWSARSFEIGYWLRRTAQGQGYMSEAVRLVTQMAFEDLDAQRVFIRCAEDNHRSSGIPQRLGFKLEGVMRNDICQNGVSHDTLLYALTPEEFWSSPTLARLP